MGKGTAYSDLDKITTTIRREPLADIIAGREPIEYREIKPYWEDRLAGVGRPFLMRMRNGMAINVPEVTVLINRVRRNSREDVFELHIAEVVDYKHWDKKKEQPQVSARASTR